MWRLACVERTKYLPRPQSQSMPLVPRQFLQVWPILVLHTAKGGREGERGEETDASSSSCSMPPSSSPMGGERLGAVLAVEAHRLDEESNREWEELEVEAKGMAAVEVDLPPGAWCVPSASEKGIMDLALANSGERGDPASRRHRRPRPDPASPVGFGVSPSCSRCSVARLAPRGKRGREARSTATSMRTTARANDQGGIRKHALREQRRRWKIKGFRVCRVNWCSGS